MRGVLWAEGNRAADSLRQPAENKRLIQRDIFPAAFAKCSPRNIQQQHQIPFPFPIRCLCVYVHVCLALNCLTVDIKIGPKCHSFPFFFSLPPNVHSFSNFLIVLPEVGLVAREDVWIVTGHISWQQKYQGVCVCVCVCDSVNTLNSLPADMHVH